MSMSTVHIRINELRAELAVAREHEFEAITRRRTVEARLEELERLVGGDARLPPACSGLPLFVTAEARGRRMLTILECLAEVAPRGLTTQEIIERARRWSLELRPGSTRAQLSQAQRKGWVRKTGRAYVLITDHPALRTVNSDAVEA